MLPAWRRKIEEAVADGRTLHERRAGKVVSMVAIKPNCDEVVIVGGLDERQYRAFADSLTRYWDECESRLA
jgi:hypothetical protein